MWLVNTIFSLFEPNHFKHEDRNISSSLLGVIISFRWRPSINKEMIHDFIKWTDHYSDLQLKEEEDDEKNKPDVIVVCLGVHYGDEILFESHLSNHLLPAFQNLLHAARTNINSRNRDLEIIWVNQRPLTSAFHPYTTNNQRMQRFNQMANTIFKYFYHFYFILKYFY